MHSDRALALPLKFNSTFQKGSETFALLCLLGFFVLICFGFGFHEGGSSLIYSRHSLPSRTKFSSFLPDLLSQLKPAALCSMLTAQNAVAAAFLRATEQQREEWEGCCES